LSSTTLERGGESDRFGNAPKPVVVHYCATFLKPEMLHVYRQITGISRFRTHVFTQKRENTSRFPFEPITLLPKPSSHWLRRIWQKQILKGPIQIYRSEADRIASELRRVKADLLHIYFGHIGVHLLPLIEICPVPVVLSFHGADVRVDMESTAHRKAMQRVLSKVALVLARSESLVEGLVELGCPKEKIRVHRTGIPLKDLPFVQRAIPADSDWKLVQACRLIPKKGLRTSLRAYAEFVKHFPEARFCIAGEGPMLGELREFCTELGVKVDFPGFLSQEALRRLYSESHLFLHPSQIGQDGNQEGVPNAMLEAMATGMPVLATRHGGIPEAVEDGISGILVEETDSAALARRMLELARDPAAYRAMSRAANRAVVEKFEQGSQIEALEGYYAEAIGALKTTG